MECHNQSQTGFLQVGQCRRPIKSVLTDYTKMCPLEFTKFNKTPHLTLVRFQKELHKWACLGWKLEVEVCQRTLTRAKIERLCKKEGALLHLSKLKNVPSQRKQGKTYPGQDFKRRKFHLKRVSLRQGPWAKSNQFQWTKKTQKCPYETIPEDQLKWNDQSSQVGQKLTVKISTRS
jgi:hypothetical protein